MYLKISRNLGNITSSSRSNHSPSRYSFSVHYSPRLTYNADWPCFPNPLLNSDESFGDAIVDIKWKRPRQTRSMARMRRNHFRGPWRKYRDFEVAPDDMVALLTVLEAMAKNREE